MARTWGDFSKWIRADFPGVGENEAQTALSQAYRALCSEGAWHFLIEEAGIATDAPYSTGTISVVEGSTTVTATGATWNTAWVNRKLALGGVVYRIASFGSTSSATLEVAYAGASQTDISYTIYRDVYPLPTDCDPGRALYLFDNVDNERLAFIDYRDLVLAKNQYHGTLGTPTCFSRVAWSGTGASAAPVAQIELGIDAPSDKRLYTLVYLKRPALPTASTQYPLWPEDFEDLLYLGAAVFLASRPHRPHGMRHELRQRYASRLWDFASAMGGGANMDRYIKRRWPINGRTRFFANVKYVG